MVLYMMLALLNAVCIIFLFFAVEFYIVIYVNAFCFNVLYLGYQQFVYFKYYFVSIAVLLMSWFS